MPAVREERVKRAHSSSLTRPSTSTTQLSEIATATAISTATRTQRAMTSGSFGVSLAGVWPTSCKSRRRTKACSSVSKTSTPTTRLSVSSIAAATCTRSVTAP